MYIFTNNNNVILYTSSTANKISSGYRVDNNVIIPNYNIHEVDKLPGDYKNKKYLYVNKEFVLNKNYYTGGDIDVSLQNALDKLHLSIVTDEMMTLEQVIQDQANIINQQCTDIIYNGIDVEMTTGLEHFSLTMPDQNNIQMLANNVRLGFSKCPYHSDKFKCRQYSAEEILKLEKEMMMHILYHTTYCNAVLMYLRSRVTKEGVRSIDYTSELPASEQIDFQNILMETMYELERVTEQQGGK